MMRIAILVAALIVSLDGYTQIDTEFWFAPPEVTSGHGDSPVYLRLSTLHQAAVVKVLQPGRGNPAVAVVNIPANTTQTIDLSSRISDIETRLAASVMKTGVRITATAPITAYYEVGAPFNSDIFALKGRNALGNNFVIPAQNFYHNSPEYSPLPSSSFDIVATQNNTVVRVRPTRPLVGHLTDTLITVKLNAGETYSFRKSGLSAADNPAGTVVESNKPIAITLKDDSVINGGCRDILGDQLVPLEVAGTEYVVLKGFLSTPEFLFITATADDTKIYIQGSATPVTIPEAGAVYRHQVTEKSTYVLSDKTIYIFHVTGFGCEMGLAILPSINCKGSPQIGFTRTTNEFFGLNLLVMKEGVSSFSLNGSAGMIPPFAFTPVPGTNDKWYTAQLSFNEAAVPVGRASIISNTVSSFQVGIINGNASSTCRYGYFSSFSTLFIGDDLDICQGESATLDAGPGKESYLWNTGSTAQQIQVTTPGTYWVKVKREDCVLYDTIQVAVKTGHLDLGPDVVICRGDTASIDGQENFSWRWSDGSTDRILETTLEGKYWASVSDYTGCAASDTVMVSLKEPPVADLGADVLKCKSETVRVDATVPNATYLWNDGTTEPSRNIQSTGVYWVKVTSNGCTAADSILVEDHPGPQQDSIYGTPSVCPSATGIVYRVDAANQSTYQWFVKGGAIGSVDQNEISVDWSATNASAMVKALVTDDKGCAGDTLYYPVSVNVILLPEKPAGPDTLCVNNAENVVYTTPPTNGSLFQWHISGGQVTTGQGSEKITVDWAEGLNKLWIEESSETPDTVCHGVSPPLTVYVFEDSTSIYLNYVSVDTSVTELIHVHWNTEHFQSLANGEVFLYRRSESTDWKVLTALPPSVNMFSDEVNFSADGIYDYHLAVTNSCDELLTTGIHNNIFLEGSADSLTGSITLRWNHYSGWGGPVERYEVWRKIDSDPGYRLFTIVPASENSFTSNMAAEAFEHQYVIRAIQKGGPYESWSNAIPFTFEHEVVIPNIITPNGDEYNEYFQISNIKLFKNAELTIIDRWGKTVYHVINYQNDWDGGGLSSGVYFYLLDLKRKNKIYRGPLSIL